MEVGRSNNYGYPDPLRVNLNLLKENSMSSQDRLSSQYNFLRDSAGNEIVQIRDGSQSTYRLLVLDDPYGGLFRLEHSASPPNRNNFLVYHRLKDLPTRESALVYVCNRHNNSAQQIPSLNYTLV